MTRMFYNRPMRALILCLVVGACYHPSPPAGAPCATDDNCPVEQTCSGGYCLPRGTQPTDDACGSATCRGNDLVGCGAPIACPFGCADVGTAHCFALVPSNALTPDLLAGATMDVDGTQRWTFDSATGEIRKGNLFLRHAGDGLDNGIGFTVVDGVGVFTAHSFTVLAGLDWQMNGSRPVALYAATTIDVSATIDAGGALGTAGPGGAPGTTSTTPSDSGCDGRAGRLLAANAGEGGGGGGGATAGGNGGPSSASNPTGLGGAMCASPSTIPLRGGHGGGAGSVSIANNGGGGGGAIALVAMQAITINPGGAVATPGGGGLSSANANGGGGGGSGGAVLVEAPVVAIHGAVTANGGSGAAPTIVSGVRGSTTSASPAPGGIYSGPGGTRRGGSGGAGMAAPGNGETYAYDDGLGTVTVRGAGGGGAVGRVEIRARSLDTTGMTESPSAALHDVVLQ